MNEWINEWMNEWMIEWIGIEDLDSDKSWSTGSEKSTEESVIYAIYTDILSKFASKMVLIELQLYQNKKHF